MSVTEYNYIPNPRMHINASSGWSKAGDRVTSVPWGSLPAGATAAYRMDSFGSGPESTKQDLLGDETALSWIVTYGATGSVECSATITVECYDAAGAWMESLACLDVPASYCTPDAWHTSSGTVSLPEGTAKVALYVCVWTSDAGHVTKAGYGYFTLARLGSPAEILD